MPEMYKDSVIPVDVVFLRILGARLHQGSSVVRSLAPSAEMERESLTETSGPLLIVDTVFKYKMLAQRALSPQSLALHNLL